MGFLDKIFGGGGESGAEHGWEWYQNVNKALDPIVTNHKAEVASRTNTMAGELGSAARLLGYTGTGLGDPTEIFRRAGRQSAVGATQRSQLSAIDNARSFATRGGLAFGGGATALAGMAARDASYQRSAMFGQMDMQAAMQGRSMYQQQRMAENEQLNRMTALRAQMIENALGQRAGFQEGQLERINQFNLSDLANRYGLAGSMLGQGLAGDISAKQNQLGAVTGLVKGIGSALGGLL